MIAIAQKEHKESKSSASKIHKPKRNNLGSQYISHGADTFLIQRKSSSCACGGGCQRCKSQSVNLPISQPNDASEIEADAMADKVMRMSLAEAQNISSAKNAVSRKCSDCEEEKTIQHKKGSDIKTASALPMVSDALSSGGKPLDKVTRTFMESRFNYDFNDVQIHDGESAAKSAKSISALAYTLDNNIVFNSGQYDTNSDAGKRLLAHELTHVVQQRSGAQTKSIQRFGDTSALPSGFTCPVGQNNIPEDWHLSFDQNNSVIRPSERGIIEEVVDGWWMSGGNSFIDLAGYASEEGSQQLNWNLSCSRVRAVYNALQQPTARNNGIPGSYLEISAHGESFEFGDRPANRRVSITITMQSLPPTETEHEEPAPAPTPPTPPPTLPARSDRRTEYETERDRRRRTTSGGRGWSRARGGDLDSDWAGRAILGRYLTGGGDWYIFNDSNWSRYMVDSDILKTDLALRLTNIARANTATPFAINETFPAEMENGEGIVGYQYLHGTNATVGGFQMRGTATVTRTADGGRRVDFVYLMFTWNDVIDPNPQYGTDTIKSIFAEIITLGEAEAYDIHITWLANNPSITFESSGSVVAMSGYPFD